MVKITISTSAYNEAQRYAKTQNLSVDEFVASLISNYVPTPSKKYRMKTIKELSPELQEIIGFARSEKVDEDDINGDKARMEYLTEKYGL